MAERDDRFWANFLGISASDWKVPGLSVSAHQGLGDFNGLWSFKQQGGRVVVSAPPRWVERLRALLAGAPLARLIEPAYWQGLLGDDCTRTVGPAYQGCLEPLDFRPVADGAVSLVEGDGSASLEEFRQAVDPEAWADGGLEKARDFAVRRERGQVVAMCGYRAWSDEAGDPCVLVHPQFCGKGYGSAVVSAVVARALAAGKTLLYQTLEANLGAVGIASKLGLRQYASHVAVRLK
jgi:GNAT superfamily N-acetyltransferase